MCPDLARSGSGVARAQRDGRELPPPVVVAISLQVEDAAQVLGLRDRSRLAARASPGHRAELVVHASLERRAGVGNADVSAADRRKHLVLPDEIAERIVNDD